MMAKADLPSQNREPPAYQEFAASMLARLDFREMSLGARGLLYTLRLELWVNGKMPADPAKLARLLGCDVGTVRDTLSLLVPAFFASSAGQLVCPELESYRRYQQARRTRLVEGGSAGGKKSAQARKVKKAALPLTDEELSLRVAEKIKALDAINAGVSHASQALSQASTLPSSLGQALKISQDKTSQNQPVGKGFAPTPDAQFVQEYESTESEQCTAEEYRKARGD